MLTRLIKPVINNQMEAGSGTGLGLYPIDMLSASKAKTGLYN
ncbi:MAG: hypothetical protein H6Q54_1155 [Deltaproteobacteria bacterium]|nr:hypothetical protein [Deltaproteobacteria bacterium]